MLVNSTLLNLPESNKHLRQVLHKAASYPQQINVGETAAINNESRIKQLLD